MGVSRGRLHALVGAVLRFQLNGCEAGKSVPSLGDPGCGEQQKAGLEAPPIRVPKTPLPLTWVAGTPGIRNLGRRVRKWQDQQQPRLAAARPLGFPLCPEAASGAHPTSLHSSARWRVQPALRGRPSSP